MKELYQEYLQIPQNGKIRDKVMMTRVVLAAVIIIACLAAMSFTAYAYFTHGVISSINLIQSADFDLTVTVTKDDATTPEEPNADGIYLLEGGKYSVILTRDGTASTGFCIVEITVGENTRKYHTKQFMNSVDNGVDTIEFILDLTQLSEENVEIKFIPHWGTSSYYGYDDNENNQFYITGETLVVTPPPAGNQNLLGAPAGKDTTADPEGDASTAEPETTEPLNDVYIVKSGDTLNAIANRYGVSVERLRAYNNIENANLIYPGMELGIPPFGWMPSDDTTEQTPEDPPEIEPEETDPIETEPVEIEPEVTEPEVTEPEVTEPEVTEPEETEPEVTEPEVTEPEVTEPEVTEPEVTEPEVTEPEVTEPEVTEPEVTEPEVTEPEVTEPEETEPVETDTSDDSEEAE